MSNNHEQFSLAVTKGIEQGAAAVGGTLGIYSFMIEHKEEVIMWCALVSVLIAFMGYVTNSLLTWYFKKQHLELARMQQRRADDNTPQYDPENGTGEMPSGLPDKPRSKNPPT